MDKPIPEAVDALRREGWAVAVHNDYRLQGEQHTFWLFTKGGSAVKGEGRTDAEALSQVREQVAALTAAQQQGQAVAECHCATCTCAPGMTPAVRFDTSTAAQEGAVRDHLIALGWTPPNTAPPPSAPVGVEVKILARDVHYAIRDDGLAPASPADDAAMRNAILRVLASNLAQQPAAVAPVEGPLSVFCDGEWRYETGQTFSAKDLDEAAFIVYSNHFAQQPAAVDEAMARRLDDYLGGEFDIRIGKQAAHAALCHALAAQHQEPTT